MGGKVEDLSNSGDLDLLRQGAKLVASEMNIDGFKSMFGGKKKKGDLGLEDDDDDEDRKGDDDEYYSSDEDEYEDIEEDGDIGMQRLMDGEAAENEDDDEEEEDMDGFFESGAAAMGAGAGAMLDQFGLRRKTFVCDLHHIRLTNLVRRRRDVQIHFTLGAVAGEGGAVVIGDPVDEPSGPEGGGGEVDPVDVAGSAGGHAAGGGKRRGILRRNSAPRKQRGENGGGANLTSKPLLFKTDVAVKAERSQTYPLRRTFHGKWKGKHEVSGADSRAHSGIRHRTVASGTAQWHPAPHSGTRHRTVAPGTAQWHPAPRSGTRHRAVAPRAAALLLTRSPRLLPQPKPLRLCRTPPLTTSPASAAPRPCRGIAVAGPAEACASYGPVRADALRQPRRDRPVRHQPPRARHWLRAAGGDICRKGRPHHD